MIQTFLLVGAMEQLKNNHNKIGVDEENQIIARNKESF